MGDPPLEAGAFQLSVSVRVVTEEKVGAAAGAPGTEQHDKTAKSQNNIRREGSSFNGIETVSERNRFPEASEAAKHQLINQLHTTCNRPQKTRAHRKQTSSSRGGERIARVRVRARAAVRNGSHLSQSKATTVIVKQHQHAYNS